MPSKAFSKDFLKDPTRSLKLIEKEEKNVAKLLDGVFKNIEKDIKDPARVHAYTPSGISFDILETMKKSSDLHFDDIADDLSYMAEETATSGYTSGRAFGAVALGAKIEERQKEWRKLKVRINRFDDEFKGMSAKLSKDVRRVISDGVVNEITQGEMISQIKKISGAGKIQAQTIVRTETMKAVNDGVLDRYEEDEVGIVEALTVDDERRCDVCGPLDGVKFPINDHPAFPIHPRCRCTWIPVAFDYDGDVMRWSDMDEDSTKADYRPWSPDDISADRDTVYKIGDSLGEKMSDALTGGTEAQNKAVGFYKNGPFDIVNGMLRGVKGKALKKLLGDFYEEPEMWKTIEGIEAACKKDKIPKGLELWRGLGVRPSAELKLLKAGDTFSDDAFQSFSFDHGLAEHFAQKTVTDAGYEKTFVRYVADGDMTGARIGSHFDESEILIPRGTEWKITSKTTKTLPDGGIENYYTVTANKATGTGPIKVAPRKVWDGKSLPDATTPEGRKVMNEISEEIADKMSDATRTGKGVEKKAAKVYSGGDGDAMNAILKGIEGDDLEDYFTEQMTEKSEWKLIDALDIQCARDIIPKKAELWSPLHPDDAAKFKAVADAGGFVDRPQFTSFLTNHQIAGFRAYSEYTDAGEIRSFIRYEADGKVTGALIDDSEILVGRGKRLRVTGVTELPGKKGPKGTGIDRYYTVVIEDSPEPKLVNPFAKAGKTPKSKVPKKILEKAEDASWDPSKIDTLGTQSGNKKLVKVADEVESKMGDALVDGAIDEIESVEYYQTINGCDELNVPLRNGDDPSLTWLADMYPKLDAVCASKSVPEGLTLWRGLGRSSANKLFDMDVGVVFEDKAYQSFSYGHSVASAFAKDIESTDGITKKVFLRTIADKGMTGAHLMGNEFEILLPRGTKWKIVDVRTVRSEYEDNIYYTVKRTVEDISEGEQYNNQQWR